MIFHYKVGKGGINPLMQTFSFSAERPSSVHISASRNYSHPFSEGSLVEDGRLAPINSTRCTYHMHVYHCALFNQGL